VAIKQKMMENNVIVVGKNIFAYNPFKGGYVSITKEGIVGEAIYSISELESLANSAKDGLVYFDNLIDAIIKVSWSTEKDSIYYSILGFNNSKLKKKL
jgi:hypothetical protein